MADFSKSPGLPKNLDAFALTRLEVPKDVITRTLGAGETVIGSFEVYFDSERLSVAEWWFLVITTCGFYLLNKWLKKIKDIVCCRKQLIVHYSRGTMVITNKGRCICWKHSYDQDPDLPVANPKGKADGIPFLVKHSKTVFDIRDVRQMSLRLSSPEMCGGILDCCPCLASCCRCCGLTELQCGVSLTFNGFDTAHADPSGLVTPGSSLSFIGLLAAIFGRMALGATNNIAAPTTLTIVSANEDIVHNANGKSDPAGTIKDLAALQAKVIKAMQMPRAFLGPADPKAASILSSGKTVGCTIVDNSGVASVPQECLPLMTGEVIIDSKSFVYKLNFEDWVRILSTSGWAYCIGCFGQTPIRSRRFQRAVVILTNVRVVSIYICERAGAVPEHMTNFEFSEASYFPGKIRGGVTTCDGINRIDSSLLCDGGRLTVSMGNMNNFCTFPLNCCPKSCPVTTLDPSLLAFARRLQTVAAKATPLDGLAVQGAVAAPAKPVDFDAFEKGFLPLVGGEKLVNKYVPSLRMLPCFKVGLLCCPPTGYCCSSPFGLMCAMCTCGVRPMVSSESSIVSSHAVYHLSKNVTNPCCKSFVPAKLGGFVVAWAPIHAFRGQEFEYTATGFIPKAKTCYQKMCCKKQVKVPGIGTFCFSIKFDEYTFVYSHRGLDATTNFLSDPALRKELKTFDRVQLALIDKQRAAAAAAPASAAAAPSNSTTIQPQPGPSEEVVDLEAGPTSSDLDDGSSSYDENDEDVEVIVVEVEEDEDQEQGQEQGQAQVEQKKVANAAPPPAAVATDSAALSSDQVQIISAPINFLTALIGCSTPQQGGSGGGGGEWKEAAPPSSLKKPRGKKGRQTDL